MPNPPRIFGKEMRLSPACTWKLEGVELGLDTWCNCFKWRIGTDEIKQLNGSAETQDEAVLQIERAITRIREAAGKLGT